MELSGRFARERFMKRTRFYAVLAVFGILFFSGPLLRAESQARIVRLSLVDGSVELDRATGKGFEKAIQNMPITQGMRLRTGAGSNAEVEFESGSTLRLVGNTTVSFGRLSLADEGAKLTAVNVEEGTAYFNVKKESHDEFAISFAGRELRVTHPSHLRVDVNDSRVEVAMFKGEADIVGDNDVKLKKDETLAFDRNAVGDEERYDIAKGVSDESSDAWDKQREDYLNTYAQQSQVANSPYAYGMSDLGYYGTYYNDAGYGYFWRPFGVDYNWNPYDNGAWVWYPGFGYTWVSSYPWGWAPYRYGRWVWLPAYGWVWQPGYWHNWWRGPVIVNAPPHYYPPHPPRHHDHDVAWVGHPPNNWPEPYGNDHHRQHDDGVRTKAHDRDDSGARQTMTMAGAPQNSAPKGATTTVPADGFAGGNGGTMMTVIPADAAALTARDRERGLNRSPHGRDAVVVDSRQGDFATVGSPVVTQHQSPRPPSTPHSDGFVRTTPPAQTHVETPRPAPHVETPHATPRPAQHVETPHVSPAPRMSAPSAPRMSAPSAPRMEAPHMSMPHPGGGGGGGAHSSPSSGGGHSPK
jgi:hypothetical protein